MHRDSHRPPTTLRVAICVAALALIAPLHAAAPGSFVWKATAKGTTIYLAGSIHMLPKDAYPLHPAFERAFTDSDLLVEEVDLTEMLGPEVQMQTLMRGMLPSGQTLDKVLTPSTLAALNKAAADVGAPVEALQRLKPWMIALTLEGLELHKAGFDSELGLDMHFYKLAKSGGKSVQGLETVEYQISRFDDMTLEQQDRLLAESLKEMVTERDSVTRLTNAWKIGDAASVERIILADLKTDPLLYQRLLVERNRNWLPKIEALFGRKTPALVLVGAAHLVGPDGLVSMLKAKGYTIEQQ
jgi:uncharacterized protein YbaP (TraB family)